MHRLLPPHHQPPLPVPPHRVRLLCAQVDRRPAQPRVSGVSPSRGISAFLPGTLEPVFLRLLFRFLRFLRFLRFRRVSVASPSTTFHHLNHHLNHHFKHYFNQVTQF